MTGMAWWILLILCGTNTVSSARYTDDQTNKSGFNERTNSQCLPYWQTKNNEPATGDSVQRMEKIPRTENIGKKSQRIDDTLRHFGNMHCNGSLDHHTCYQVTGIHGTGLYVTIDVKYRDYYFYLQVLVNNKYSKITVMNGSVSLIHYSIKYLNVLSFYIYKVTATPNCRYFCADIVSHYASSIYSQKYIRKLGCFVDPIPLTSDSSHLKYDSRV